MIQNFRKVMAPLEQRIRMGIARAIVTLVDDARQAQSLQIELLDGEAQDGVERMQNYGLSSHPFPDAEAIVVCPAGLRSHAIAIVVEDRRYRVTELQPGEVALYDDLGNIIRLGRDEIEITAVSQIRVEAPIAEVTADSVEVEADQVTITSDAIDLGASGGQKVARIGDDVDLNTGKIITGSDKVKAA